ncbi:esterase/lipase [Rhizodiscina lignyota]|uniref:Esterase/lipase n=1 Tax=Rhizodiscina lignyota TaxID=1504668 RepID=A0A9P4IIV3_9PEZI|nr:esterase/lipase [Rhizodiscina lignyota]
MTSHQLGTCCYKGAKHEGTATGQLLDWQGIEAYVKHPEDGSTEHAILLLTDIIGHRSINSQLIADQFAANGYFIVMPDLFFGDSVPLNKVGELDIPKWFAGGYNAKGTNHGPSTVDPIVELCLSTMRTEYKCQKIGAAGYCFGAKYVLRHLRSDGKAIDVGHAAHPSHVERDDLQDITGPFSIAAAETDPVFPPENRHETEDILKSIGVPYQINLYGGVTHGFAVRGDLKDRVQLYAKENAFLQAVQWFDEHLKNQK